MMRDMRGPKKTHMMVNAVQPVIHEIFEYDQGYPVYPGILNAIGKPVIIKKRENDPHVYGTESKVQPGIQNIQV
jgi:hypothetical protein